MNTLSKTSPIQRTATFIGAVEIGSTTIKILVAELRGRKLAMRACVGHPSQGVERGMIVDYKIASMATHRALLAAESLAGRRIDEVEIAETASPRPRASGTCDLCSKAVSDYSRPIAGRTSTAFASGVAVTTPEERNRGALVIDLGGGTTHYVHYRADFAPVDGVWPCGGRQISEAIGHRFRLSEIQADLVKHRYGRATVLAADRTEKVWLDGNFAVGDRLFSLSEIETTTAENIRAILVGVKQQLGRDFSPTECAAGVVLTGGASKLAGIVEFAASVFGVGARLGAPSASAFAKLVDPSFSTVAGLLRHRVESCK